MSDDKARRLERELGGDYVVLPAPVVIVAKSIISQEIEYTKVSLAWLDKRYGNERSVKRQQNRLESLQYALKCLNQKRLDPEERCTCWYGATQAPHPSGFKCPDCNNTGVVRCFE